MTNQEAFDIVWDHAVVRGEPASYKPVEWCGTTAAHCLYLGPNGSRCWVGVLMRTETARQSDQLGYGGDSAQVTFVLERLNPPELAGIDGAFLCALQISGHDMVASLEAHGAPREEVVRKSALYLADIADRFQLVIPAPDKELTEDARPND